MSALLFTPAVWWTTLGAGLVLGTVAAIRLRTIWTTWRATAILPVVLRRLAGWIGTHAHGEAEFFTADGASDDVAEHRRNALARLSDTLRGQDAESARWSEQLRNSFSDLRFTDASRVPFAFMPEMRKRFNLCSVVTASRGPYLQNLDGRWTLDVSGSYGLNVAGFDQYKTWIQSGWDRVRDLGPVLGPVHPVTAENIEILKQVSGMDEVSFHMSGTEAVMAAVRLARFNTRRKFVVCFSGAYHGWWDGVQPGLGSERTLDDCLTLKDLAPASLEVIRRRRHEIAAVLVNPIQSFHPNSPPPSDAVLLTSEARRADESTARYADWLQRLREVCSDADVPLILDEVYTGFRLAPGGAQEFFGIDADMVVYGKTVAGGLPIGVVCGKSRLMRRSDPRHPLRMAYIVGTFSAHPLVMGAMNEFLRWVVLPAASAKYQEVNESCLAWVRATNTTLAAASLPVRVISLGTIWTVLFKEPGRYNWLLQYYLRAEGVTLSWVGTGRCLVSMDFTPVEYDALQTRLVSAVQQMHADGWWLTTEDCQERDRIMRQRLIKETLRSLIPVPTRVQSFYSAVMKRKDDDHHASHNNAANQYLHLVSSSVFLYCYATIAANLTAAMFLGLASLFLRQFGHAVLEPACHEEEKLLLGYNTRNKTLVVLVFLAIPIVLMAGANAWSLRGFISLADAIALKWFQWTLIVVFGRVAYLTWKYDLGTALIWFVKLVTDPVTDVITYFPRRTQRA
jgi:glutamate-1-semialdehyde 2,1-aminomutase